MEKKLKIIFAGTPEMAVQSLTSLYFQKEYLISAVITQPDRKVGRKQVISPSPVKIAASKFNIKVLQPEKIIDIYNAISEIFPDLIVVVAYGQIIPESILRIPRYGCLNVHGSILPKYRGASCLQAAILNGDKETGVTIMKMDKGLDTGPILSQSKINIENNETAGSLYAKIAKFGSELLIRTIPDYLAGKIELQPQNNDLASYCKTIKKDDGKIYWEKSAEETSRFIRAMNPWPYAWTMINDKRFIIKQAQPIILLNNNLQVGQLFIENDKPMIKCGTGAIAIEISQFEGKKEMNEKEILSGYKNLFA